MTEQENKKMLKHRIKFLALILVFLSPFVAGWLAFYVFEVRPGTNHYGTLVEPARPLSFLEINTADGQPLADDFWKKWTFVLIDNYDCQQLCRENLYYLRQMRIALGRDTDRVQNVIILANSVSSGLSSYLQDYPDLTVVHEASSPLIDMFKLTGIAAGEKPGLYLIDPAGNLMMTYPAENKPKSILSDIRRLLKVSQIG